MATDAAITEWIERLKDGDDEADKRLWAHYFERLVRLARTRLPANHRRMADEEDVVLSAMDSFLRRAKKGKYEELHGRNDLWRLLARITCFKCCDLVRSIPKKEAGESALGGGSDPNQPNGLDAWMADKHAFSFDPSTMLRLGETQGISEFIDRLGVESRELLEKLNDEKLRLVALRRMQGYTLQDIAKEIDCVTSTVELKIRRIKKLWAKEMTA